MTRSLVVVGDALLDIDLAGTASRLSPDAPVPVVDGIEKRPRPGGAALAAYLAARDGREVVLIAPLADDEAAARLRALLSPYVQVVGLPWTGSTPVKTRVRAGGQSLVRLDTGGAAGTVGPLPAAARSALEAAAAVLVSDYGHGAAAAHGVRAALKGLSARVPVLWDPHPRGATPVPGVRLATPNRAEAAAFAARSVATAGAGDAAAPPVTGMPPGSTSHAAPDAAPVAAAALAAVDAHAGILVRAWRATAVAVTLGAAGALLSFGSEDAPLVVPATAAGPGGDPCGAGDRFAAAAAALLADGALASEAVHGAVVAASAFVAAGGAAAVSTGTPGAGPRTQGSPAAAAVHAARGTVVATGGCFDLLHAGHVATLRAARALGDHLVVCLNSDASVRRLKGPQRPLQTEQDRAQVLQALECVDEVVVFDEDTPEQVLSRLRPDVWAKGGDYAGVELPESRLLASWGGQVVVLPYLTGRSTSLLVRAAGGPGRQERPAPVPTLSEEIE